jgi:hypothetical protein
MPIDVATFLNKAKGLFHDHYSDVQKGGVTAILGEWDNRMPGGDLRWLAYMLATAYHETNQQMIPVREAYWLSEKWRKAHLSYYPYYGRGYVQLTHSDNYDKAGKVVGQDLVKDPDLALDPAIAAAVMFMGMEKGWFRRSPDGKPHDLPRYFSATTDDPVGARNIVNGKEIKKIAGEDVLLAEIIAEYHMTFLAALQNAGAPAATARAAVAVAGPAAAAQGFAAKAADIADVQWQFFGKQTYDAKGNKDHAGHTEGEDGWYQRVGDYWQVGTNSTGLDGLDHDWPWSAAFISYVMRTADAGTRFRYSTQHSVYISQGIRDYLRKEPGAGYWTMRLNEATPEVGDIVCWGRQAGIDYDHQNHGDYHGHSDLVVEVTASQVWIIGGNVGNSVTRRPLPLNKQNMLEPMVQNGENLFGLMKCRL